MHALASALMHSCFHRPSLDPLLSSPTPFALSTPGLSTACWYTLEGFDRPLIPANGTTTGRQLEAILDFFEDDTVYDLVPHTHRHVLVVCGAMDLIVRPQNQKQLAKRLPAAWLTMFAEGAHATYIEYWSTLVDVLNVFLVQPNFDI